MDFGIHRGSWNQSTCLVYMPLTSKFVFLTQSFPLRPGSICFLNIFIYMSYIPQKDLKYLIHDRTHPHQLISLPRGMWCLSEDTTFQTRVESKSLEAMPYTQHITKSFWFYLLLISQHCLLLFNHFFPLPHLHCNPSYLQGSSMASYCLEDLHSKPFTVEPQHIF